MNKIETGLLISTENKEIKEDSSEDENFQFFKECKSTQF